MVSTDSVTVTVFAVIGVVLWYASASFTDSSVVRLAVLIGVGVVIPTLINQYRERSRP
ncbi:hypothetical protein [Halobellus captivus]|uniref:hypothetical protein n=1 Tax=Halobellus captivus TaxID=2592614 RepID=UPI00193A639B|nr:hypothetical protein [Halobellus captivus]